MSSDRLLIDGCVAGDRRSWEQLVLRYERLIYSIALRSGLNDDDAADVFLTVCGTLLENLEKLRDDEHLTGWMILTARRESWRMRQSIGRTISVNHADADEFLSALSSDEPSPFDVLAKVEDEQMVRLAMQEMGGNCRQLLELRYLADPPISYGEIARRLDVSTGAIGPMRGRCLQKLRKILEEMGF